MSCEFHGWDGEHYRFPRFQQSDGLFLDPLLSALPDLIRETLPAGHRLDRPLVHLGRAYVEDIAARLGSIDPDTGAILPLYPDVVMDPDRRFRIRRTMTDSVIRLEDALGLLDLASTMVTPEELGAELFKWFRRATLRGEGRDEPSKAESAQWAPFAIAALNEFRTNLDLARAAGFANGVLLNRKLEEVDGPVAEGQQIEGASGHGYAHGALLPRLGRFFSRVLGR